MYRVYKYGVKPPVGDLDEIEHQLRLGNKAWNELNELYYEYKEKRNTHRDNCDPQVQVFITQIEECTTKIEEFNSQLKAENSQSESRYTRTQKANELREEIKRIKDRRLAIKKDLRELRININEKHKESLKEIWEQYNNNRKSLLASFQKRGLYWPTKGAIGKSHKTAVKEANKNGTKVRFKRFLGNGRLVVQNNADPLLTWGEFINNTQGPEPLKLDEKGNPIFDEKGNPIRKKRRQWKDMIWEDLKRLDNGKLCGFVNIRISTTLRKEPVFVRCRVILHREPPADVLVKEAELVCRGKKWSLCIALKDNKEGLLSKPHGKGIVAVDAGWRQTPNGIKVLTWLDSDGNHGVEYLPEEVLTRFRHADTLRSIRDKNLSRIIEYIREVRSESECPDWFKHKTQFAHSWKSSWRIKYLLRGWDNSWEPKGIDVYEKLQAWIKQDDHNRRHEKGTRTRAINHRKDWARNVAAKLRTKYGLCLLDTIQLKELTKKGDVENPNSATTKMRRNARESAPGYLITALKDMPYEDVEVKNTSRTCSSCGVIDDKSSQEILTCSDCGHTEDRDLRACRNVLSEKLKTLGEDFNAELPSIISKEKSHSQSDPQTLSA